MKTRLNSILFCLLFTSSLPAVVITVDDDGVADFNLIQSAIDIANNGDKIVVSPGIYNEAIDYQGKSITIRSTDGPQVTTIDAGGVGSVVTCNSDETSSSVLRGFGITGGITDKGGGLFCNSAYPTITHCIFYLNVATDGGAVYNKGSNSLFINCLFYNNTATDNGGAVNNFNSDPSFFSCTFARNTAPDGAFYNNVTSSPTIENSILWADSPGEISGPGTPLISYSDVQGGFIGTNNLDIDPLFMNASADDYHLQSDSPVINKGNNFAVNVPATDLDNQDRIVDEIIDLGVYEQFEDCDSDNIPDSLEPDTDEDGVIDDCDICPNDPDDDADGDGICGDVDVCPGFDDTLDSDNDDIPNGCDTCPNDSDNDADGDGVCGDVDICPGFDDTVDDDSDGVPNGCDICLGGDDNQDNDNDGIPDFCDVCPGSDDTIDSDDDSLPDGCDLCPNDPDNDSDGDGVCGDVDLCPGGDDNIDTDSDGIPDDCDPCPNDAVDLDYGLIAYYPFKGNADDTSGNSNHATVHGPTLTTDRCDNVDSAYEFDHVDDYMDLPGGLLPGDADFSISVWIKIGDKPFAPPAWKFIIDLREDITHVISVDQGILKVSSEIGSGTFGAVPVNQWLHIACVYDDSAEETKVYRDGIYVGSQPGNVSPFGLQNRINRIGANSINTTYDLFDGKIDEIRIYDRTLCESEIQELYSGDSDCDGVPDAQDICPGFDDNIDSDGDGIPDGCDILNILSPNGGETYIEGSSQTITWEGDDDISLAYSVDSGSAWITIVPNIPNNGELEWSPIPAETSDQCLVRACYVSDPSNCDISDNVFIIFECLETLTADFDGNCFVNMIDFGLLAQRYLMGGNPFDPDWVP